MLHQYDALRRRTDPIPRMCQIIIKHTFAKPEALFHCIHPRYIRAGKKTMRRPGIGSAVVLAAKPCDWCADTPVGQVNVVLHTEFVSQLHLSDVGALASYLSA